MAVDFGSSAHTSVGTANAQRGRTKGMAWADQIRTFERLYGRDKLVAAVRAMPARWRPGLNEDHATLGVLDATWYPEEQRNAFFDAITADLGLLQQQTLARAFAKTVMDRSLRGLHRMIFAIMATPERFVKHAQSLWDVHHDTGRLRMKLLSPSSIEAAVLEWPTHHPFACMVNHYACLVTLVAMGCAQMSERRVCNPAVGECVGLYLWRPRKG
jgi:hypothetical protein